MKAHVFGPKSVFLQSSLAFRDDKVAGFGAGEDPSVACLEAEATVACVDNSEFGEFGGELERAAMAVAVVGFQLWSGSWLRHRGVRTAWTGWGCWRFDCSWVEIGIEGL